MKLSPPRERADRSAGSTTPRSMHMSQAATEDAIPLLDERLAAADLAEKPGDILETRRDDVEEAVENRL